ncbi:MAG: PqqD family protein, partial [Myxococcota bacterium]|nr:PqqD family protein [Myxococcota bacterium]
MTEPAPRLKASSRVILSELPDGTGVLLDLDSKFYFALNATAVHLWKAMQQQGRSAAELAEELSRAFDVEPEGALADV